VDQPLFLLVATEVLIVQLVGGEAECGILLVNRTQTGACRVSGPDTAASGWVTTVVRQVGDGAVLETADGALWEVPQYDRYDTGYWLPPYDVLITANELYLYNLRERRRIWVSRIR